MLLIGLLDVMPLIGIRCLGNVTHTFFDGSFGKPAARHRVAEYQILYGKNVVKLQFAPLFDEKIISRENIITEKKVA